MDFAEDEVVLFRHLSQSSKRRGELVVTNVRIVFLPAEAPQECKSLVWANIEKIEYSPASNPVTAIKLKTVQGAEQLMIQLIGGKNEERLQEFAQARTIITNARKPKTAEPSNAVPAVPAAPSSSAPAARPATPAASMQSWREKLKADLLQNDATLAALHRELVEGQILSVEDFWNTHSDVLKREETKKLSSSSRRGLTNALWTDIVRIDPISKKKRIVLSPENKEMIFKLFPHVRVAFEHEVPLNHTEEAFWKKFLEAEYHSGSGLDSRRYDALFNKYEAQATDIVSSLSEQAKKKQRCDKHLTTSAIDLTASYGDTRRAETLDDEDRLAEREKDLHGGARAAAAKEIKVFQESVALMSTHDAHRLQRERAKRTLSASAVEQTETALDDQREQRVPVTVQYVTMDLSKLSQEKEQHKKRSQSFANNSKPEASGVTVEYVSTGHKRNLDVDMLRTALQSGFLSISSLSGEDAVMTSVSTVSAERANRLFADEVTRLQDLQRLTAVGENQQRKDALPVQCYEEQRLIYKGLTELLCHFYSLMHRGAEDEATRNKVKAILDRIVVKYKKPLETRKLELTDHAALDGHTHQSAHLSVVQKEHLKSVINGHLGLIERANRAWRIYAN